MCDRRLADALAGWEAANASLRIERPIARALRMDAVHQLGEERVSSIEKEIRELVESRDRYRRLYEERLAECCALRQLLQVAP